MGKDSEYSTTEIRKIAKNAIEKFENQNEDGFFEILDELSKKTNITKLRIMGEEIGKVAVKKTDNYFVLFDKIMSRDRSHSYDLEYLKKTRQKLKWADSHINAWVYGGRAAIIGTAFSKMRKGNHKKIVETIERYINENPSWYVIDTFCHNPMAKIIMEHKEYMLEVLKKWLKGNKWLKRAVAVYIHAFFAEFPNQDISIYLGYLDKLMKEDDQDIKKGMSWALREMTKNYKKELLSFIEKWIKTNNKHTKWIIKNGIKKLNFSEQEKILNQLK